MDVTRVRVWALWVATWMVGLAGCDFPRPADVASDGGGVDSSSDQICTPGQALRCDGNDLVRCNSDATAVVRDSCALGCSTANLRCNDLAPSNGLAPYLDMAAREADLDLGTTATINTDDGSVEVDGQPVTVRSATQAQTAAPSIRVFIVRSLTTGDVTVTGSNALAIVSDGEIKIGGVFAASAHTNVPGPGRFNDDVCHGKDNQTIAAGVLSGCGGGGFGTRGASGGFAANSNGTAQGGSGGQPTGEPTLVPLRGGCDAGLFLGGAPFFGAGGGAIQLVANTKITVAGIIAANGASNTGGGSGGGILLEAPVVEVPGNVVANGGSGSACGALGEDGRLDAIPATGAPSTDATCGHGGNGAARNTAAVAGANVTAVGSGVATAGSGGGGVGRVRVNTIAGGLQVTGVFSPNPSTGIVGSR
jgi:hypothetical protein